MARRLIARRREARGPHRAGRRDRAPISPRLFFGVDLCRRLAGAAAAADLVRRRAIPISSSSRVQLGSCDPTLLIYPPELGRDGGRGRARLRRRRGRGLGRTSPRAARRGSAAAPRRADDIAYLQYSSGSTRFPHGVAITHHALLNNLAAHGHGMELQARAIAASPGCPGITTWGWSAASCRRSPTRFRPII